MPHSSSKDPQNKELEQKQQSNESRLRSLVGIDHVTGEDVEVELIAEFPPRHQLHVDLVASLHLQYDHLQDG